MTMIKDAMCVTPELMDFYEDENYPDIIQAQYGWAKRSMDGVQPFLAKAKAGHSWRNIKTEDVSYLIGEAASSMTDLDTCLLFKVDFDETEDRVSLHYIKSDFLLTPMHAAGSPNLVYALNYYIGKRDDLHLLATRDGVFWLHE